VTAEHQGIGAGLRQECEKGGVARGFSSRSRSSRHFIILPNIVGRLATFPSFPFLRRRHVIGNWRYHRKWSQVSHDGQLKAAGDFLNGHQPSQCWRSGWPAGFSVDGAARTAFTVEAFAARCVRNATLGSGFDIRCCLVRKFRVLQSHMLDTSRTIQKAISCPHATARLCSGWTIRHQMISEEIKRSHPLQISGTREPILRVLVICSVRTY
jgi:hypothetical protein